jgi:hypothetical protein
MSRLPPDFRDLLIALNAAEARYLLVGGHAVAYYGRPRATKDFDVWIEASPDNAGRVMAALRVFGAPLSDLCDADLARPGQGFRMGSPPFRIEILTEISGVDFGDAWPRRETWETDDVTVFVIARGDLIENKRAAGRTQDIADVEALEAQVSRPKQD